MEEEDKKILLDIKKQVKKNSKILKDLRSKNRREAFGKFIYYAFLIISAIYIWQYIQPFYESFSKMSGKINQEKNSISDFFNKFDKLTETIDKINLTPKTTSKTTN